MALEPLFHVTEKLGATQASGDENQGAVRFRLFLPEGVDPQIKAIGVAGDFQGRLGKSDWDFSDPLPLDKSSRPGVGDFWEATSAELPAGFYQYKYRVAFRDGSVRIVTDPCARYGGTDHQNAGFVIGGSRPEDNQITELAARSRLRDLVIYEMHPDDFTDEYRGTRAPFDAIIDRLDYLADLGVNAILFMPWTAWQHKSYDWGYVPFQYFAVEYVYANDLNRPSEKISWLKKLIDACHRRGIHVIMDGVFNHCSEDFPYKYLYLNIDECPYTAAPFGGIFPGLQDLDFSNHCTRAFIRDVCLYWISVFKIDGIRFDNTVNFYVAGDIRGVPGLLSDIYDYLEPLGQENFSTTIEHIDIGAASVVNSTRATSYWDNALYGECFSHLWSGRIGSGYLSALNNSRFVSGPEKVATTYLSNHDHSGVAWQAGASDDTGAHKWYRTQPHAIALLTGSAVPLIANGQEFAEDYWIPEDDHGTGRRVRPRPLRWSAPRDAYGSKLLALYKKLIWIRRNHPCLRSGDFHPPGWHGSTRDQDGFGVDVEQGIVVYHRWGNGTDGRLERFIIALNFSDQPRRISLSFSENGRWTDLLNDRTVNITNYWLDTSIESNWGHIYFLG